MRSPILQLKQALRPYCLLPHSIEGQSWIPKYEIINALARHFAYQTYLEIGVRDPREHFFKVIVPSKTGVDPAKHAYTTDEIHNVTSDEYFSSLGPKQMFDLILIDGLHTGDQVYRDITNSLRHLSQNGTIVLHDLNPLSEEVQLETPTGGAWNGSSWKGFVRVRSESERDKVPLSFYTVDTDHGVGLIHRGRQPERLPALEAADNSNEFSYQWLDKNRTKVLNLCSIKQFSRSYLKWRSRDVKSL